MFLWPIWNRLIQKSSFKYISTKNKTNVLFLKYNQFNKQHIQAKKFDNNSQNRFVKFIPKSSRNLKVLSTTIIAAISLNLKMASTESIKGIPKTTFNEADKLFDDAKYEELLEFLKKQTDWENNEQILWRLARCEFQLAKKIKDQKSEYENLVNVAYDHVNKSLELDDKNGLAHKWASILLDTVSTLKGTKERVLQILNVRNHMEKAIEYAPNDPTSYYLLGEWHFGCYKVSWWERKLANIAFGKLPDADMEVALKMFEKAEEVEKDFYSKNKLMLAKTLIELNKDKEKAINLLKEVVEKYSNSTNWDDKEVSGRNFCSIF